MRISNRGREITSLADWRVLAAPKGKDAHWEDGKSAKELARAWCEVGALSPPNELIALLEGHPKFAGIQIEDGFAEHRVAFDKRGEPRNADLNLVARQGQAIVAISIEAKADEAFGGTVRAAIAAGTRRVESGKASNAGERAEALLDALLPPKSKDAAAELLPYQLLTAVAGLLVWAESIGADRALLVVHEFVGGTRTSGKPATSAAAISRNAKALNGFLSAMAGTGVSLEPGQIQGPFTVPGGPTIPSTIPLYIAKVRRDLSGRGSSSPK